MKHFKFEEQLYEKYIDKNDLVYIKEFINKIDREDKLDKSHNYSMTHSPKNKIPRSKPTTLSDNKERDRERERDKSREMDRSRDIIDKVRHSTPSLILKLLIFYLYCIFRTSTQLMSVERRQNTQSLK